MIRKIGLIMLALFLTSCNSLNFKEEPLVMANCNYEQLTGPRFIFSPLPPQYRDGGYQHIYVAQSRVSNTLPYERYLLQKGKLTDEILVRYYPVSVPFCHLGFGPHSLAFGNRRLFNDYDCYYNNLFYYSPQEREEIEREAKFVVRKAILANCEVVYISLIDSLSADLLNPKLIEPTGLSLIDTSDNLAR